MTAKRIGCEEETTLKVAAEQPKELEPVLEERVQAMWRVLGVVEAAGWIVTGVLDSLDVPLLVFTREVGGASSTD